jgi:hypothetical protein
MKLSLKAKTSKTNPEDNFLEAKLMSVASSGSPKETGNEKESTPETSTI